MADPNTAPLAVAMTATLDVAPDETRLHRFLLLGTADGTYLNAEPDLTADTAPIVVEWARQRTRELVDRAVDVSDAGRAPTQ